MKMHEQLYNKVCLCLLAILALTACNDDTMGTTDTTTLNLVFSTRANNVYDENALKDEGIKTLRVILVQNGVVVENYKTEGLGTGDEPLLSQTITFWQIPKLESSFYAIANEESIEGLSNFLASYEKGKTFGNEDDTEILSHVIGVQQGTLPGDADEIATYGLPIAGKREVDLTNATDGQEVEIPITRAVAKMELTLTNATGESFSLNQVVLGEFFPGSTYLFPQDTELTLPDSATPYTTHTFLTNATIDNDASQTFYFYFYESNAGSDAYTIALNDGTDYSAARIMLNETTPLSSITRNTCLKVTGTINSTAVDVDLTFKVVVVDWDVVVDWEKNDDLYISFD